MNVENNIERQFVTYEIALALKELGFNEQCFGWYGGILNLNTHEFENYKLDIEHGMNWTPWVNSNFLGLACTAPLWQQCIDWFREEFKYHIEIQSPDYPNENDFNWTIHKVKKFGGFGNGSSDNYYEALEQAILKTIELINEKQTK